MACPSSASFYPITPPLQELYDYRAQEGGEANCPPFGSINICTVYVMNILPDRVVDTLLDATDICPREPTTALVLC